MATMIRSEAATTVNDTAVTAAWRSLAVFFSHKAD
jgi:hypothetical protein